MARRRKAASNDKQIFRRTAAKTKSINIYPMNEIGGTRM